MLRIEPGFYLFCALLLLVLPLNWVLAAVSAAVVHELCHLAAVILLGGSVEQIRVHIGGAQIRARLPDRRSELLAAMAGPMGSLLLTMLCHVLPRLAICGWIQGIYNLLPLGSLDGGRVLRGILEIVCPNRVEAVCDLVEGITLILLLLAAVSMTAALSVGWWPVLAVLVPVSGRIRRKIPCKQRGFGVQ